MRQELKSKKEIHIILFVFILLAVFIVGIRMFSYYEHKVLHTITTDIIRHPLQVSNAALNIKLEIYKIHRDMKDIALSQSKEELQNLIKKVNSSDKSVYKNLSIIKKYILGDSGLILEEQMLKMFNDSKPIRDKVISHAINHKNIEAVAITKNEGAQHVLKMEFIADKLYLYARDKAEKFKNESIEKSKNLEKLTILFDVSFLLIFILIVYYTIKRISNYMYKSEHLNGVLSIARDINQMIGAEKDIHTLISKCTKIFTNTNIYDNARIMLLDRNKKTENIFASKNFDESKNALNIELKHKDNVFGHLTLCVDNNNIDDISELELLDGMAFDISSALYSIKIAQKLQLSEQRYRTMFEENRIVELIIDPADGKIVDCNNKALDFYGYSRKQITSMLIGDINILSADEIKNEMQLAKNEQRDMFLFKHKLASGEIRDVEVYSAPIELENSTLLYSDIFDITEQKEHQKTILHLKDLYANIIISVDNLIFVKDIEHKYIECNRAFEKFLDKSKEDIIGKNDFDFFDDDIAQFFRDRDEEMLSQKKPVSNFEWVTYPDDSRVYLLTVKSPLFDSDGELIGLVGTSADFTVQHQLFERLKEAQHIAHIASWEINSKTNKVIWSDEAYQILGMQDKESLDSYENFKNIIHPDDIQKVDDIYYASVQNKTDYNISYRIVTEKDKKIKYLEERGTHLIDQDGNLIKSIGTIQDITEQKHIQLLLEQKKNELETIIQEAPNPMILHQDGGKIIMLNQAWINSSGFSLEDTPTINAWVEEVYDDTETILSVKKYIHSLYEITEKVDEGEFTFLNKNRDLVTWQFSSAPLGVIDGKRTIISSAVDITELKQKDEMLINQSRHAAMGEMIGMIAHQWRQPISTIAMDANNMLLDIALEDFNTTEAEKYANSITEETQHLSRIIDDFSNFFKPDRVISKVNIREIIDNTLSMEKDSLKNNNIQLTASYETDKEVKAYPRELMQVFVNIINNSKDALKLKRQDNASISIRVYEDEKYINTEIRDNGGGIDADILPKVFDPYFSTKDEKSGTGLGLYMSKVIIENHLNGILEVYNNDEGACFTVKLLKEQIGKGYAKNTQI